MATLTLASYTLYEYKRALILNGKREGLIIEIENKEGQKAFGEIAPLPGFSVETIEQAKRELKEIIFPLFNQKTFHLRSLYRALSRSSPSVQFGIEMPLLDLFFPCKEQTVPLCVLAVGERKSFCDSLKINLHSTIKLKLTPFSLSEALSLIDTLLPSLEGKKVRIDCNQRWSLREANYFASAINKKAQVEYYEEPICKISALSQFCAPLALDETARSTQPSLWEHLPNLQAIVVKPTLSGGVKALEPLAHFCLKKGVDFILSSSYESEIGIAQIVKLRYRLRLPLKAMGLDTCRYFTKPLTLTPLAQEKGSLISRSTWHIVKESIHGCFRVSL